MQEYCLAYKGNLIVFSRTLEDHLKHLDTVFSLLSKNGLRVQQKKSKFLQEELVYNNNLIKENRVVLNYKSVEYIQNWPIPENVKQLSEFTDMMQLFKGNLNDYNKLTSIFEPILNGILPFKWTDKLNQSFMSLKAALITLLSVDLSTRQGSRFILYSHFTQNWFSCALVQQDLNIPIAFLKKKIINRPLSSFFKDNRMPSMLWTIKEFKSIIKNNRFQIVYRSLNSLNEADMFSSFDSWVYKTQTLEFDLVNEHDTYKLCEIILKSY